MPQLATITYSGTLLTGQVTTSPWPCWGVVFPERGSVPLKPQFHLDVLQPMNVDGARYRVSGAHFPTFKMVSVSPAADFATARKMAREMELIKGETIVLLFGVFWSAAEAPISLRVVDVVSVPSAKVIVGATSSSGTGQQGPPGGGAVIVPSSASVDTMWTCQAFAP
jgi:hypothetical protein